LLLKIWLPMQTAKTSGAVREETQFNERVQFW
jgi:hypothetical protein